MPNENTKQHAVNMAKCAVLAKSLRDALQFAHAGTCADDAGFAETLLGGNLYALIADAAEVERRCRNLESICKRHARA